MSEQNGVTSDYSEIRALMEQIKYLQIDFNRLASARSLGVAYSGDRQYYDTLGYDKVLSSELLNNLFQREHIANSIVKAFPEETWRLPPEVIEDDKPKGSESEFEASFIELSKRLRLLYFFEKADILACKSYYSVIYLGFDDASDLNDLSRPVNYNSNLSINYVSIYSDRFAEIKEYETDLSSPRYGFPRLYDIQMGKKENEIGNSRSRNQNTGKYEVHWSRVMHIAHDTLDNEIVGTPVLQPVYNLFFDMLKIVGGSAEAFWQAAQNKPIAQTYPDHDLSREDEESLTTQLKDYLHDLRKFLAVQGVEVKTLNPEVNDSRNHFLNLIDLLAGALGIPKRYLIGSERGELSSYQDEIRWANTIQSRHNQYANPLFLREFINRMQLASIMPEPRNGFDGYSIVWPPLVTVNPLEDADRKMRLATAINRASSQTMFTTDEIKQILDLVIDEE